MATIFANYWKEGAIALLIAAVIAMYSVIGNRNDEISALNQEIARINAINTTNDKWTQATSDVLTSVVAEQNAGIDRVIGAISQSSADISTTMDAKRAEDAKANAALKTYINNLPKATDCSVMMDNLIKGGNAVKW